MLRVIVLLLSFVLLTSACQPAQIVIVTATPAPTETNSPTQTPSPIPTLYPSPTDKYSPEWCAGIGTLKFDPTDCPMYGYGIFSTPINNYTLSGRNFSAPSGFVPHIDGSFTPDMFCTPGQYGVVCAANIASYSGEFGYANQFPVTAGQKYMIKITWGALLYDSENEYQSWHFNLFSYINTTRLESSAGPLIRVGNSLAGAGEQVWAFIPCKDMMITLRSGFALPYGIFDANSRANLAGIEVFALPSFWGENGTADIVRVCPN